MREHPISRGALRDQGLTDRQVNRLLAEGRLQAVRRGVHSCAPPGFLDALEAVLTTHRTRRLWVSHLSAARMLGLPEPLAGWRRPEFSTSDGPRRSRPDLRIAVGPLPPGHTAQRASLPTTSPGRTVLDCARTLPGRDGLAIADAALHRTLVTEEDLMTVLDAQSGWPGSATARAVLSLADGRRESPLESWSAWAFDRAGLPRPQWQLDLLSADGAFLGRCDAWWEGVAGEADGRSKYRLAAAERGGADAATLFGILDDERGRQRRMDRAGIEVVRWGAGDVLQDRRVRLLAERITTALLHSRPVHRRYRTRR